MLAQNCRFFCVFVIAGKVQCCGIQLQKQHTPASRMDSMTDGDGGENGGGAPAAVWSSAAPPAGGPPRSSSSVRYSKGFVISVCDFLRTHPFAFVIPIPGLPLSSVSRQAHLTGGGYGRLLIDTHFGQNLCHASVMIFLPISFR